MSFIELTEPFHYNVCYSWWLDSVYSKNQTVVYIKESYMGSYKFCKYQIPSQKIRTLFLSLYTLFFLSLTLSLYFPPYKFCPICKSTQSKTSQFLTSKVPNQVQNVLFLFCNFLMIVFVW